MSASVPDAKLPAMCPVDARHTLRYAYTYRDEQHAPDPLGEGRYHCAECARIYWGPRLSADEAAFNG